MNENDTTLGANISTYQVDNTYLPSSSVTSPDISIANIEGGITLPLGVIDGSTLPDINQRVNIEEGVAPPT